MKGFNIIALVIASCGMSLATNAIASVGSSKSQIAKNSDLRIGETAKNQGAHKGPAGEPGIGVKSIKNGKLISFAGLTRMAPANTDDVHVISMPNSPNAPKSHRNMGVFNFAQVADAEVYFGEWSQTGEITDISHTSYYSGKDITTNMPTGGTATYSIKGINQYAGGPLLQGHLNADFGAKTLKGNIDAVSINAKIKDNATFRGLAEIGELQGKAKGHFFGDQAKHISGITQFSDHSKDIAFGGSRGDIQN
ncbi:Slam-dependent surface lipoprotein [Providencia sneebia]|uniref:Uncharacterized protein n=1 Tax=Providencia sneebia DSM 19967 TaxID=1141660 RepID=K8WLX8_9GAMM|nr:Slam-dependent surface lipoprotein [Providencia sneebia]EKT60956.1 hypothetical protein OO7_02666 [Providencia sneebia DSM 19967]